MYWLYWENTFHIFKLLFPGTLPTFFYLLAFVSCLSVLAIIILSPSWQQNADHFHIANYTCIENLDRSENIDTTTTTTNNNNNDEDEDKDANTTCRTWRTIWWEIFSLFCTILFSQFDRPLTLISVFNIVYIQENNHQIKRRRCPLSCRLWFDADLFDDLLFLCILSIHRHVWLFSMYFKFQR